ncbi:unnamed protein product, partial [Durusdinium trenchii]
VVVGAINGEGGPIYWISMALTNAIFGSSENIKFTSPTKGVELGARSWEFFVFEHDQGRVHCEQR